MLFLFNASLSNTASITPRHGELNVHFLDPRPALREFYLHPLCHVPVTNYVRPVFIVIVTGCVLEITREPTFM